MQDPSATHPTAAATPEELGELYDNPLERLQLLAGDDAAIAAFLDEIDVRSPREREMLGELARPSSLARPNGSKPITAASSSASRACGGTDSTDRGPARLSGRCASRPATSSS